MTIALDGVVALVTGASPNSIAWSSVAHLLRGGATVVVVTTSDTPERIAAYRDLERRYAGPGAQLHIVRANLASFADIDALDLGRERAARKGVHLEGGWLPGGDLAHVGFVHLDLQSHGAQVLGDQEQHRRVEGSCHGLAGIDLA